MIRARLLNTAVVHQAQGVKERARECTDACWPGGPPSIRIKLLHSLYLKLFLGAFGSRALITAALGCIEC